MSGGRARWWLLTGCGLVILSIPLARSWFHPRGQHGCALIGLHIEPRYQVRIVDQAAISRSFCCVRCAQRWLALANEAPSAVFVTDEGSAEEITAESAWFVVSPVATNPITRNRIHTFRDRLEAERHARDFEGLMLSLEERPLQIQPSEESKR